VGRCRSALKWLPLASLQGVAASNLNFIPFLFLQIDGGLLGYPPKFVASNAPLIWIDVEGNPFICIRDQITKIVERQQYQDIEGSSTR
jgi:hypothetical protein